MRYQNSDPCFISHDSFLLKGLYARRETTENHRIMATLEALVITTLLTVGSSGVYGNDGELSTTTRDTVLIPCDFGEGTIRNVYWYYNDGTGPVKILTLFKGNVSIDAAYANRASLHDDSSTLILTDIMLKDEGTYRCDVDREGQTAVPNINTELHVFSLTAETLPEITQCNEVGKSSACNFYTKKSITINCALGNVYPAKDAELVWYRDEQRVHSTDNSKENDDGTFDITGEIEVSESGNLTCNATFLTAQGTVSTGVLVAVTITLDPGNNLKKRYIAIGIGVMLAVVVLAGVIVYFICCSRGNRSRRGGQKYSQMNMVLDPENGRTSSNSSGKREVTSEEITKLAKLLPEGKFVDLFNALGFDYNYHQKILKKHQKDITAAVAELLEEWKAKTDGYTNVLDEAMKKAEVGGLIPKYKKVLEGSNIPSTTGATTALTTPTASPTEKGSNGAQSAPSTATAATTKPVATTSSTSKPKAGSSPTTAAAAATPSPSTTIVSTPASTTTSSTTVATPTTAADAVAPPTAAAAAGTTTTTTTTTTASTASTTSKASTNAEQQQSTAPTSSTTMSAATNSDGSTSVAVSDEKLGILATHIPSRKYDDFVLKLGIGYEVATTILDTHRHDFKRATKECLHEWKNATGGSVNDLKKILEEAGLKGLLRYIK